METHEQTEIREGVEKAIDLFKDVGREDILKQISDPHGPFVHGRRYLFALGPGGDLLAHPFSKHLLGRNLTGLRDSNGKGFIRKLLGIVRKRGSGFVEYLWPTPDLKEHLHKTLFFERVDGMILCSGSYTEKTSPLEAIYRCFRPYGPA